MKNISLKITIIVGILVFILSFGATYAINVWSSGNTLISGTTKCFKVNYTKGQDINFSDGLVAQTSFNKDNAVYTTLSISKNVSCDLCGLGSISANITSSIDLSSGGLSYKIYQGTNEVKSGNITKNGITTLYDNFDIKDARAMTFKIYFYLDASKINNNYLETSFSGKIYAEAKSTKDICNISNSNDLYTKISSNATLDTNINFSKISSDTNGKGIYVRNGTEDDANPIYYYRGAVGDNNVLFANFCWKIVRTTETGGIKLIYSGTPNNGTCNNTGDNVAISSVAFNTSFISPTYVGYKYGTVYNHASKTLSDSDLYGTDVTYTNGTYTLTSTQTGYSQGLSTHHYTCFNSTGTCTKVYYIFCVESTKGYYITLASGKKANEALSEMLDNNTTDSTIKAAIDNWYSTNMTSYTNKLEDTVWCNDRSIYITGGWNPNGGSTSGGWTSYSLVFSRYKNLQNASPNLTCSRNLDKFTTSTENGNGELTYPVGLLTVDEIMLAGGKDYISNTSYYLYTGTEYWTLTSRAFISDGSREYLVTVDGSITHGYVKNALGVRPTISLKPENIISSGNGTAENPYVIS